MTSTNLLDYFGQGLAAARPVTPDLHSDAIGLYWATDTNQLSMWAEGAWVENILTPAAALEPVQVLISDPNGSAITTGDGKAYFPVPATLSGRDLVGARAVLDSAGTGGGFLMQVRRKRSGVDVDMLSTRVSIDSGENDSEDATTPPVINASNDDVLIGDRIYFDLDGVPTGGKGLVVELTFG